jgi:hypothetical protein
MPRDPEEQPPLRTPRISYSTRVHLKRRMRAIDYKFLAAIVALVLLTLLIVRYVR